MESTFFSKLIKDCSRNTEQKTLLYMKSKWSEMALEVIVYSSDTNETFKGELLTGQLSRIAEELELPLQDFYNECKEAITARMGAKDYLYRLESETFRLIKKETFEVELLEVPLRKLSSPMQIIDHAFEEITQLKEKCKATESLAQHEEMSTNETLDTLRNCLKEKDQMEKVLMRKFLMILNTKKEEIIKLKDQLEGLAENGDNRSDNRAANDDVFDADTQPLDDMED